MSQHLPFNIYGLIDDVVFLWNYVIYIFNDEMCDIGNYLQQVVNTIIYLALLVQFPSIYSFFPDFEFTIN